jgi:hypothetical protein
VIMYGIQNNMLKLYQNLLEHVPNAISMKNLIMEQQNGQQQNDQ